MDEIRCRVGYVIFSDIPTMGTLKYFSDNNSNKVKNEFIIIMDIGCIVYW